MTCLDCGDYSALMACDLVIPRDQWLAINPQDGGLLCANCMVRRAAALPNAANITGRITTGDDSREVYEAPSSRAKASQTPLASDGEAREAEGPERPNTNQDPSLQETKP